MSQADLAARTELSIPQLSRIERGERIGEHAAQRLYRVFGENLLRLLDHDVRDMVEANLGITPVEGRDTARARWGRAVGMPKATK